MESKVSIPQTMQLQSQFETAPSPAALYFGIRILISPKALYIQSDVNFRCASDMADSLRTSLQLEGSSAGSCWHTNAQVVGCPSYSQREHPEFFPW